MRLERKLALYLGAIHLAVCVTLFLAFRPSAWLLVIEVAFLVSLVVGYRLLRSLFLPLDLLRTGTELIAERDFSTTFRTVGQPELDALVDVYNRMQEQLRAERLRLREQNLFLDKVFQALPAGLVLLDHDRRVSYVNPGAERLLELSADAVRGMALGALPIDLADDLAGLSEGSPSVVTARGPRRIRLMLGAFRDRGFERAFVLLEELTDDLRRSEKAAYRKVVRMMAHEVNNSVGAVCSLLESCANYGSQLTSEDRTDFAGALAVAADRMRHLDGFMSGFAEVVRLPPPNRAPCDLVQLLRDIVTLLGPDLVRRRIDCSVDVPAAGLVRDVDKNQLEQVFVNIIKNAMESIDEDGSIEIECTDDGGLGRVEIRDTGAGISAAAYSALFTPFFSTKSNGLGLGLTVVHEILDQHGYRFGLERREVGATFWVELC